ncbi:MAG: anti-phage ZorAB system protein ZorA [Candidatus Planktophila sp.]
MFWQSLLPRTFNPFELQWPIKNLTDLTDVWLLTTIGISILALVWALYRTWQATTGTGRYLKFIEELNDTEAFAARRNEWLRGKGMPLAMAFNELLVEVPTPGKPLQRSLKRSANASEVFNSASLAHGLIGNRFLLAMPGILTGLGVLGTFVGLQIGIGALELEQSQIENLDKSIAPIIKGCSTAFATSVWGVVCSLLFTVIEKFLEWLALTKIRRLQFLADSLIPRYTPEESMIELQRSSLETEGILKGLAVAIGDEMQKAMNRLGSSITEAVKDALGNNAQDLGKMSADLMSAALKEELGKLQSVLTGMADGFKSEFLGASSQLNTTISKFETVIQGVDGAVQSSREAMNQAVERLTAHDEVVIQLKDGSIRLKEAASELKTMKETLALSSQRNLEAANSQEKVATLNESVAQKFQAVGDKLPQVQEAISDGARVIASLAQPMLALKDVLDGAPQIFGQQAEIQADRDEKRSSLLLKQTEKLASTVAAAAEKFAQVETLSTNLGTSAENLERTGASLAGLATAIEEASIQNANAAKSSEKAALAGERAAEKMSPLPASFIEVSNTLNQAGSQIKLGAEAAKDVYRDVLLYQKEWFKGIEAGLRGMKDQVQMILDAYGDKVEGATKDHMTQWTKAVEASLSKFASQVETLEGAINDLTPKKRR